MSKLQPAPVGQRIVVLEASSESEFELAFAAMVQQGAGALLVMADPFFNNRREQLIALAARYAIPALGRMPGYRIGGVKSGSYWRGFTTSRVWTSRYCRPAA
jgi:putative ABC transport system substrate-binding protein